MQRGFLVAAQILAHGHVAVKGLLHHSIVDLHIVQNGAEGGVAAVVRPVGVDHPDLGDGGVPVLTAEIVLAEPDIAQVHGQTLFLDELLQSLFVQLVEAVQHRHGAGDGVLHLQGILLFQACLAGLHRVDDILLDLLHLRLGQAALQQIDAGRADERALALADELDALGSRVGALVELAGQILHSKGHALKLRQRVVDVIHRRLAEHGGCTLLEQCLVDALHVVAVEQAQAGQAGHAQQRHQFILQPLGFHVEAGFLFHIDTIYHRNLSSLSVTHPLRQR